MTEPTPVDLNAIKARRAERAEWHGAGALSARDVDALIAEVERLRAGQTGDEWQWGVRSSAHGDEWVSGATASWARAALRRRQGSEACAIRRRVGPVEPVTDGGQP